MGRCRGVAAGELNRPGYDIFNPAEVVPEFTADIGTKKGEKVDDAILKDGRPIIMLSVVGGGP